MPDKYISDLRGTRRQALKIGKVDLDCSGASDEREVALPDADGTLMLLEQKYTNLIALGLAYIVTADEDIPPNRLVAMYGDPVSGRNVYLAGASPASAFCPDGIAGGTQGIVLVGGIVELDVNTASISLPANIYVSNSGYGSPSPGGKGACTQYVGQATGDEYASGGTTLISVSLFFGEFS